MSKISTPEMEVRLARYFDYRQNLIVPCVHWGMNMHECDLLIVSKHGYVTEVEIKISRADLRADAKKRHGHNDPNIKYLYFAVPEKLKDAALQFAPERAGILAVHDEDSARWCRTERVREPVCMKGAGKMTDAYRYKVARLGALRIWGLKEKLL